MHSDSHTLKSRDLQSSLPATYHLIPIPDTRYHLYKAK